MYGQESIFDPFFIALYSGAALLALVAALYLLLRRGNAFEPALSSSRRLRRWTAAFLLTVTLSHVWWWLLGTVWLSDDRLVRNGCWARCGSATTAWCATSLPSCSTR